MKHHAPFQLSALAICMAATLMLNTAEGAVQIRNRPLSFNQPSVSQLIVKFRNEPGAGTMQSAQTAGSVQAAAATINTHLSAVQRAATAQGLSVQHVRQMATGSWVYRTNKPVSIREMKTLASKLVQMDRSIEYAEPDYMRHITYTPSDPMYTDGTQWDMKDSASQPGGLNLPAAWDISTGKNTVIAVIDTGYRPHPDLTPNLTPAIDNVAGHYGYNFITSADIANAGAVSGSVRGPDGIDLGDYGCNGGSSSWHGTHVSGIVAAAGNAAGIIGVAFNAKVLPLRALGKCGGTSSDIADAIVWAAGGSAWVDRAKATKIPDNPNKANVINMSLGSAGACTHTEAEAIKFALSQGSVVVVSAGNDGMDSKAFSPANCPGVIAVGSTDNTGGRAGYTNYGATVAVAAPGGGGGTLGTITSTLPSGDNAKPDDTTYGTMVGTSQAAPHVSGVAALMLSVNPKLTPAQVRNILIKTTRTPPGNCPGCGSGIVDAVSAVKAATAN
ncbi:S8 family serine peptidase [Burkholderiaceae bacterium DAT-1]|nr:S8 family serine peptidase [Burkholderiaceae bacterium DAT-1]